MNVRPLPFLALALSHAADVIVSSPPAKVEYSQNRAGRRAAARADRLAARRADKITRILTGRTCR